MWAQSDTSTSGARHDAPQHYDAIIVGAGLAGLSTALSLPASWRVALVIKQDWQASASCLAQGGIAAVLDPGDSVAEHVQDTLTAGAGCCDPGNTQGILSQAAQAIAWLRQAGVPFSEENGQLHLTREGGHGKRRIAHAADATGQAVMATLWPLARQRPNLTLLQQHAALDLISATDPAAGRRCAGVLAVDLRQNRLVPLYAGQVVLATGGSGQLYPRTSNPAGATGDGQAMAWRAGCRLSGLEFIQFHPTGLALSAPPQTRPPQSLPHTTPLISEALRGEGALLRLPDGSRFMPGYDTRAELAPRDIVARAIYQEMQQHQLPHVHLDISHRQPAFLARHFPNILAACRAHGIEPEREPIPVAPLAHYACGGILTDLHGRTSLPGLYAIGECACTGLHGANRLASNSLLECIVLGQAAAQEMAARDTRGQPWPDQSLAPPLPVAAPHDASPWSGARCQQARAALQQLMWQGAGILRQTQTMARARADLEQLRGEFHAHGQPGVPSLAWLELRNLLDLACLTLEAALARPQSCGAHALAA
ncbi:L-aspartate oxidase [Kerstersia sp.]|uniref:L-aspartate oxidase n=1 Tax=Kerstersia sp. TaxID=1930783 RepID=UPI003F8DB59E